MTENKYSGNSYLFNSKIINNIIEVPESLYILQLISQASFQYIEDFDITEQLELFTLNYVDNICLDEIKKMDEHKICEKVYTKIPNKIESDSVLFKKYGK